MTRLVVEDLNLRDLTYIIANLREDDRKEIDPLIPNSIQPEHRNSYIAVQCLSGFAYSVKIGEQPICAFGVKIVGTIGSGWAFGTDRMIRAIPLISDFCWRYISHLLIENNLNRLEVRPVATHEVAIRWLKKLGFTHDCTLKMYGKNGEDFELYSMTSTNYYEFFTKRNRKDLN